MVLLIGGCSHTGKTLLAQKLLETYHYPYLSIDHLKMGLIRSGNTMLTPEDEDDKLTAYLWPIVREIVKTAIENHQNLIVEGCYIPFDWKKDFGERYLSHVRYICLIMTESYIETHFSEIQGFANAVEHRIDDCVDKEQLIQENARNFHLCQKYGCEYILIDREYSTEIKIE